VPIRLRTYCGELTSDRLSSATFRLPFKSSCAGISRPELRNASSAPACRRHNRFPGELPAQPRVGERHAVGTALCHDLQQRPQRRAGIFHTAVFETSLGDTPLALDDRLHSGGEEGGVLFLRPQEIFRKHRIRSFEDAAREDVRKARGDGSTSIAGSKALNGPFVRAEFGVANTAGRLTQCRELEAYLAIERLNIHISRTKRDW
jgi:hypothetical protein